MRAPSTGSRRAQRQGKEQEQSRRCPFSHLFWDQLPRFWDVRTRGFDLDNVDKCRTLRERRRTGHMICPFDHVTWLTSCFGASIRKLAWPSSRTLNQTHTTKLSSPLVTIASHTLAVASLRLQGLVRRIHLHICGKRKGDTPLDHIRLTGMGPDEYCVVSRDNLAVSIYHPTGRTSLNRRLSFDVLRRFAGSILHCQESLKPISNSIALGSTAGSYKTTAAFGQLCSPQCSRCRVLVSYRDAPIQDVPHRPRFDRTLSGKAYEDVELPDAFDIDLFPTPDATVTFEKANNVRLIANFRPSHSADEEVLEVLDSGVFYKLPAHYFSERTLDAAPQPDWERLKSTACRFVWKEGGFVVHSRCWKILQATSHLEGPSKPAPVLKKNDSASVLAYGDRACKSGHRQTAKYDTRTLLVGRLRRSVPTARQGPICGPFRVLFT